MVDRAQQEAYARIWNAFAHMPRLADGRHDTANWRDRGSPFAMCVIRLPAAALGDRLTACRQSLADCPSVRVHPDGFLHITLQELGFVCDEPGAVDEISPARLDEFAQSAVGPIAERPPFRIALGGVNSFQDAAFLEVRDGGACAALHARLFELAAIPRQPRFAFVPHATIAHYIADAPAAPVRSALAPFHETAVGAFEATQVEIVTLDVVEPYPPLRPFAIIPLGG
ncbi:MAG TPA: 2'-5' RNA ligase family protein [Thermomicrobiales bacterium]|nr:2'-5' RNA ligase family protein [Thermomicrobiales bacterium]